MSASTSKIEKISIALPHEMAAQVRGAVQDGEYASSSEVVREALREWSQRRALRQEGLDELRRLWRQSASEPAPGLDPDEIFDRLERKYEALAAAAEARKECA